MPRTSTLSSPALTREQLASLVGFIRRYGRNTWKGILRDLWARSVNTTPYADLYALRNTHGPRWLNRTTTRFVLASARLNFSDLEESN